MTITTFDKLSPQDQSLVRLAMQYRDNAYTPYSHHQVGASVRTASGTCYGGCNVEVISLQTTCHAERNAVMNMAIPVLSAARLFGSFATITQMCASSVPPQKGKLN